jgi:hypothetical protein
MRALFFFVSALAAAQTWPLTDPATVTPIGVQVEAASYRGAACVRVTQAAGNPGDGATAGIAMIPGATIHNGTIEVEVASTLSPNASGAARGFIGIAFRCSPKGDRFEYIYLRPTNSRADDQVRRNHSVQYSSHPDYPWQRMRKDFPETYESYADMEAGAWTKMRIVVKGERAELYLQGTAQPALIANGLKLGDAGGGVSLWIGPGTVGHFRNLEVRAE